MRSKWVRTNDVGRVDCAGCGSDIESCTDYWKDITNSPRDEAYRCIGCGPPQSQSEMAWYNRPLFGTETCSRCSKILHSRKSAKEERPTPRSVAASVTSFHPTTTPEKIEKAEKPMMKRSDIDRYTCSGASFPRIKGLLWHFFGSDSSTVSWPHHDWMVDSTEEIENVTNEAYSYVATCQGCGLPGSGHFTNLAAALASRSMFSKEALAALGVVKVKKKRGWLRKLTTLPFTIPTKIATSPFKLAKKVWRWRREWQGPIIVGTVFITIFSAVFYHLNIVMPREQKEAQLETAQRLCGTPKILGTITSVRRAGDFVFIEMGKQMLRISFDKEIEDRLARPEAGKRGYICENEHFHETSLNHQYKEHTKSKETKIRSVPNEEMPKVQPDNPSTPGDDGEDFRSSF